MLSYQSRIINYNKCTELENSEIFKTKSLKKKCYKIVA